MPGSRVLVPFGRGRHVGVVVEHAAQSEFALTRLKRVQTILDNEPLLDTELLASLLWAARYYQHAVGEVLETALPVVLRQPKTAPAEGEPALMLTQTGHAEIAQPTRRATRTRALLDVLAHGPRTFATLDAEIAGWRGSATTLRRRGAIETTWLTTKPASLHAVPGPAPSAEQAAAIAIAATAFGTFAPFLLDGVTGSGKTEVYLGLIERTLAAGRQALVLVPEIGLTPQTLRRFRERLGVQVYTLHSGLTDGERARGWLAAARGEARVILGTRSAIFTPLPQAGLIIVDEEHDVSYKQQDGFRYSARDLAVVRARARGVPVLLSSATPSLESLANAEAGRYTTLRLRARPGRACAPSFRLLDLRRQRTADGLTEPLVAALRACLDRGEQALVFRNRRGYAPVLLCHDCGWHADCDRCARPLTLHRSPLHLACHHCGATRRVPAHCPDCNSNALQPQGHGTERLEQALIDRFPSVPVVRIDRGTTRRRGALEALLDRLGPDQPGIYVGTQMLAKGHDLPNLTLVAILGVDEGLFSVDFRAAERLGQLVMQVAGRAGRAAKPGEVLLQTHHPDHPLLQTLVHHDYAALAHELLVERREADLPPFTYQALLRVESPTATAVDAFLAAAAALPLDTGIVRDGPVPSPMPRRAGLHRGQLLLGAIERARLQTFLPGWVDAVRALDGAARVRWSLDVDPVDMY